MPAGPEGATTPDNRDDPSLPQKARSIIDRSHRVTIIPPQVPAVPEDQQEDWLEAYKKRAADLQIRHMELVNAGLEQDNALKETDNALKNWNLKKDKRLTYFSLVFLAVLIILLVVAAALKWPATEGILGAVVTQIIGVVVVMLVGKPSGTK